jgi:hypothetical protein
MTIIRKLAWPADGTRHRASASTRAWGKDGAPRLPHQEPGTELRQVGRQDGFPPGSGSVSGIRGRSGLTTLQSASPTQSRVSPILHSIHDLTGSDVPDQLCERDRVSGARETRGCHLLAIHALARSVGYDAPLGSRRLC